MKTINLRSPKLVFIFMLAIVVMFVFNSCKKASEKTGEKLIESVIGHDADVDMDEEKIVIKTDEGTFTSDATANSWPETIPDDVPEFTDGKIVNISTRVLEASKNWNLLFEEVDDKALNAYEAKLKESGFKVSSITMGGTNAHITGEKDDLIVIVMGGDGMASLSVGIGD